MKYNEITIGSGFWLSKIQQENKLIFLLRIMLSIKTLHCHFTLLQRKHVVITCLRCVKPPRREDNHLCHHGGVTTASQAGTEVAALGLFRFVLLQFPVSEHVHIFFQDSTYFLFI